MILLFVSRPLFLFLFRYSYFPVRLCSHIPDPYVCVSRLFLCCLLVLFHLWGLETSSCKYPCPSRPVGGERALLSQFKYTRTARRGK
jgi:hypothetical protein